jgi:hypothetical protein
LGPEKLIVVGRGHGVEGGDLVLVALVVLQLDVALIVGLEVTLLSLVVVGHDAVGRGRIGERIQRAVGDEELRDGVDDGDAHVVDEGLVVIQRIE